MKKPERRKEQRYVVDAVNLILGARSYPVIDISATSARISCLPGDYAAAEGKPALLEFTRDGRREIHAIEPRIVRTAPLYVVLSFDPPREDWESYIKAFDTFHVHELDAQLFD